MEDLNLSAEAANLFRRRRADEWVEVTDDTKPLYRELAAAGLMYPVSGFTHGPEANSRPSEAGQERRYEFTAALALPVGSP